MNLPLLTLLPSPFRTSRASAEASIIPHIPFPREGAPSLLARASARSVFRIHQLKISRQSLCARQSSTKLGGGVLLTEPFPHLQVGY
jgi:hypothetical protein